MEIIKDLTFRGPLGAASGFAATKCLALGGVVVTNPAMGALYGAALFLVPSLEDMGVDLGSSSIIRIVAQIALNFFIGMAAGMAVTALCGFNFTLANAAILSASSIGVAVVPFLALNALARAFKGTPTRHA